MHPPEHTYTVRATFQDPAIADAWVAWLLAGHVDAVLAAGALSAEIVRLDDAPPLSYEYEVRYRFASRAAFEAYERDDAPRLRAEGAARFPAGAVVYARSSGAVVRSASG